MRSYRVSEVAASFRSKIVVFAGWIYTSAWWRPQSPGLNPIDFYLWGFLVAKVFDRGSQSIIDIKKAVSYFAISIEPETVAEVVVSFRIRVNLCNELAGQHFQQNIHFIQKFYILSICC